jgi:hypothetical protein
MGLDIVELVMEVEEEFGVDLPNAELNFMETVGQLHELVVRHHGITEPAAREQIWTRLLDVIERETGVARKRLVPSARFVLDLGLD